ncbi:hypothetical protein COMA2_260012 [Candidatus Nitrospira nitrificans]|uniref:Uncharacterized protein n=1 Tax=Candidatus Nitrospira nitrificans TaxID=1742973 RepID=A0A0S4LIJ9_9BACT|nr:hypothetical protein COMA2_260012 [Candidatus Nitrospira nitrificans]
MRMTCAPKLDPSLDGQLDRCLPAGRTHSLSDMIPADVTILPLSRARSLPEKDKTQLSENREDAAKNDGVSRRIAYHIRYHGLKEKIQAPVKACAPVSTS